MKNIVALSLSICFSITLFSQTWIRPDDAGKHIGDSVNLVGLISDVKYVKGNRDTTIIMSIRGKDSTISLAFDLSSITDRGSKDDLEKLYSNQYVQVKGKVTLYNGSPQIYITNNMQISIAKEDIRGIQGREPE